MHHRPVDLHVQPFRTGRRGRHPLRPRPKGALLRTRLLRLPDSPLVLGPAVHAPLAHRQPRELRQERGRLRIAHFRRRPQRPLPHPQRAPAPRQQAQRLVQRVHIHAAAGAAQALAAVLHPPQQRLQHQHHPAIPHHPAAALRAPRFGDGLRLDVGQDLMQRLEEDPGALLQ